MKTNFKEWQSGLKDGIPIALGYIAVSFTFGIIAKQSGFNPFEAVFMSITNFTSAGQFAGLDLNCNISDLFRNCTNSTDH